MGRGTVFFDLGNTLATGLKEPVRRLLGVRLGLSEEHVKRVGRLVMTCPARDPAELVEPLCRVLVRHSPAQIDSVVRTLWAEQIDSVKAVAGAAELVAELKHRGFRLGVISNTWHPYFLGFQRSCNGLAGFIDHWALSYVAGLKKPDGALFEHAMAMSGAIPSQCWMVGDSYELDVAPALGAGMKAAWLVARPEREPGAIARLLRDELPRPTWTAESLEELRSFFQKT